MLATIALATAVLGGHTQPSGMFMFAAVFPAEAQLIGNEFRMIAQGLGEDPETEKAVPVVILLACLGLASLCEVESWQQGNACRDQCAAKYCPGPQPGIEHNQCTGVADALMLEGCVECCDDRQLSEQLWCYLCGANMPNASDFAHCYAASLPRNPPPFTVPSLITGTITGPETR